MKFHLKKRALPLIFGKTESRFKYYIKTTIVFARFETEKYERCPDFFYSDEEIKAMSDYLKIIKLDDEFNSLLTTEEKKSLDYLRFHYSNEKEPQNYSHNFYTAYKKWL